LTYAGIALWDDQMFGNVNTNPSCEVCKVKLIPVDNGAFLFCKECEETTVISKIKQEKKLVKA